MTAGGRQAALAALGLAAGFASAFLGIGGGLVIVPALMIAGHFAMKRAVGTSLAAIVLISLVGVLTELVVRRANIHLWIGLALTVGSIAGSWMGARLLARLPERPLRLAYALFLAFAAYRMLAPGAGAGVGGSAEEILPAEAGSSVLHAGMAASLSADAGLGVRGDGIADYYLVVALPAAGVGLLAGLASVLFGIGGGAVIVPALTLLFHGFPFHAARATSLLTIIPTSAVGAWQHLRMGTVDSPVARSLIPLGLMGAIAGVITVNRLPARPCQVVFGLFLVGAALRIAFLKPRSAGSGRSRGESLPPAGKL